MRWRSGDRDSAGMVLARLAVIAPDLATLVVASPRRSPRAMDIARDLAAAAQQRGRHVRLLESGRGAAEDPALSADFTTLAGARTSLRQADVLTIVTGGGVLDDPNIFTAAAVADGVLLVAQQGKSLREDLGRCRTEVEQAGGRIIGAVLAS